MKYVTCHYNKNEINKIKKDPKMQCRDDLSPVFVMSSHTISSCPERFIHQTDIVFVVLC